MRRGLLASVLLVAVAAVAYLLFVRDTVAEPQVRVPQATATIGIGPSAIAVGPQGQLLAWLPISDDLQLPYLPLSTPPKGGRLGGTVLQQAKVLGAAPPTLRPYIERSYYGESGIDVELRSGIELRFGDSLQATAKWKAAVAVLADPSITALDYVDLHAPGRPAVGGSGHALPPVE